MHRILILIAILVVGLPLAAQESRQIHWMPTLEAALAEAKKRNAPVFLAINFDCRERERANANLQMATVVYHNQDVVKMSRNFVSVVAGTHARPLDVADDNQECRRFGRITYAQLMQLTKDVHQRFFPGDAEIVAPQHLIISPDGKVIDRYFLSRKPKELVELMKQSLARFRGEAPAASIDDNAASIVRALKSKDDAERAAAFRKALALLTAKKDNKAVNDAAEHYLKKLKEYTEVREAMEAISAAGTEGPLSLLLPYLEHKTTRLRRAVLDAYARAKPFEAFIKPFDKRVKREKVDGPLLALVNVLDKYADVFKDALPSLNKLVSHKQAAVKVMASFASARPGNKPVYKQFLSRTKKEANLQVRTAAILCLAKMKDKKALPTLYKVRKKETKNPTLIRALDTAIASLGGTLPDGATPGNLEDEEAATKRGATDRRRGGDDPGGGPGGGRGGGGGGRGGGGRGR